MDPSLAISRQAARLRPPAIPLLKPSLLHTTQQPTLPWALSPEVSVVETPIDPELRQVAVVLMSAITEVLAGRRPAAHLDRWAEPELLNLLEHLRGSQPPQDLRLRSVRVQAPSADALEITARLARRTGSRAAAMRLARRRGQWRATDLSIALRPGVINHAGEVRPGQN